MYGSPCGVTSSLPDHEVTESKVGCQFAVKPIVSPATTPVRVPQTGSCSSLTLLQYFPVISPSLTLSIFILEPSSFTHVPTSSGSPRIWLENTLSDRLDGSISLIPSLTVIGRDIL